MDTTPSHDSNTQKEEPGTMRRDETPPAAGPLTHPSECRVIHPNEMEFEVSSGGMTREAGVSKALVGAEGIHPGVGDDSAGLLVESPLPRQLRVRDLRAERNGALRGGAASGQVASDRARRLHIRAARRGAPAHQRQSHGATGAAGCQKRPCGDRRRMRYWR